MQETKFQLPLGRCHLTGLGVGARASPGAFVSFLAGRLAFLALFLWGDFFLEGYGIGGMAVTNEMGLVWDLAWRLALGSCLEIGLKTLAQADLWEPQFPQQ